VAVAANGSVWAAMQGGVGHLDSGAWTSYTPADGVADETVLSIAVTPAGEVWVGTLSGVSRFDGQVWAVAPDNGIVCFDGQGWSACDVLGKTRLEVSDCLVMRLDGSLWTAGSGDPVRLDGEARQVHPGAIACAPDGSLWLGTSNGAVHWEPADRP
jgi:streptogramin lyase